MILNMNGGKFYDLFENKVNEIFLPKS